MLLARGIPSSASNDLLSKLTVFLADNTEHGDRLGGGQLSQRDCFRYTFAARNVPLLSLIHISGQLVTLCPCSYEAANYRYVVLGELVKLEDTPADTATEAAA